MARGQLGYRGRVRGIRCPVGNGSHSYGQDEAAAYFDSLVEVGLGNLERGREIAAAGVALG